MVDSGGAPATPVAYFRIAEKDVRPVEEPPRPIPPTRRRALIEQSAWGIFLLFISAGTAVLMFFRFHWAFLIGTAIFLVLGTVLSSDGIRTLRVLRLGRMVPARAFLADPLAPMPMDFLRDTEAKPPGGKMAYLERRSALGVVLAEYDTAEGPRKTGAKLMRGELPFAVDFGGKITAAVIVLDRRATLWAGPAPEVALVKGPRSSLLIEP